MTDRLKDACAAGLAAAVVSGVPSTAHSIVTGRPVLEPTLAAGTLVLPREERRSRLLFAALLAHTGLSVGWAVVVMRILRGRERPAAGALLGIGIGVVDLMLVGRRFERIRALPLLPQLADHALYGATVAAVLCHRSYSAHGSMGGSGEGRTAPRRGLFGE